MSISNLQDLFIHELKDVLDAERQILKVLPKLAKSATSEELRSAFQVHKQVTEDHVERLQAIFQSLGRAARGQRCMAMEGLLTEGEELIEEEEPGAPLDAALICAAQKVEHYEIATYGSLAEYAKLLELDDAVELLNTTLAEEKEADEKLTELASDLNLVAQGQGAD